MKQKITLTILFSYFLFSYTLNAQIVTKSSDDGTEGTLRKEIADASAGDEITFADGINIILLNDEISIDKSLTITSEANIRVTLDAQKNSRVFNIIGGEITLNNLNLTNGLADGDGGALKASSVDLNLNYVNISNSESYPGSGGGIYINGTSNVTIQGGKYSQNTSEGSGGAFWIQGGIVNFENVSINSNLSLSDGSGIYLDGVICDLNSSIISNNSFSSESSNYGAGIYSINSDLTIHASSIMNNFSGFSGGGIYSQTGTLEIVDSSIKSNRASRIGAGIALYSNESVILTNVNLEGNGSLEFMRNEGGAIYASGSNVVVINDCTIIDNSSWYNGSGIYNDQGSIEINATLIQNNISNISSVNTGGGAIYSTGNSGKIIINPDTHLFNNVAGNNYGVGGAILIEEGSSLKINSTEENPVIFKGNQTNFNGGAIAYKSSKLLNLDNVIFTENTAYNSGGALYTTSTGIINILNSSFMGNGDLSQDGGAIYIEAGTLNIDETIVSGNFSNNGAAIYNNKGTVNIDQSEINDNFSNEFINGGGALYNNGGSLSVKNSMVSNNSSNSGGGIFDNSTEQQGSVKLMNVILKNNHTGNGEVNKGGGLYMMGNGHATITSCEISDNYSNNEGGAIWNDAATINIKASTISGNYTNVNTVDQFVSGNGGAIYNTSGSIFIDASTVVMNNADVNGGAIYNATSAATTTLKNSIVALNTAEEGNNFAGESNFISADYNLIGEDGLNVFQSMSNDLEGTVESPLDPVIDSLANNGGFTQTHALLEGSPAFNSGNPIDTFPDQRGEMVFAGRRDIGAFEAQANLGIDKLLSASDKSVLFPNPSANGIVQLRIPATVTSAVEISIVEVGSGRIVLSQEGKSGINILNTENLSLGTYIVRLISNQNTSSLKMLVSN